MPLGGLSGDVFRLALNTFATGFPQVSIWYMNNYPTHYLLLIGSESPQRIDWDRLLERMDVPDARADLESIRLGDPFRLLATFLMDDAGVRRFVAGAGVNSDARPALEFRAPRSTDRFSGARNLRDLLAAVERQPPRLPLETRYGAAQRQTVLARLEPYLRAARFLNRGHVSYQAGSYDFQAALEHYRRAAAANPADAHIPDLIAATARTRRSLLDVYEAAAVDDPDAPGLLYNLAVSRLAAGEPASAIDPLERLLRLQPAAPDAHLTLARAARLAGDLPRARAAADEAVRLAPARAEAHFERGLVLQDAGDAAGALAAFQRALALQPSMSEAHFNAGTALLSLDRMDEAQAAYEAGLRLDPDEARARVNLAQILLLRGDKAGAARALRAIPPDAGPAYARAQSLLGDILAAVR
jgi:tetratricopeptide (TPR) repeat protein